MAGKYMAKRCTALRGSSLIRNSRLAKGPEPGELSLPCCATRVPHRRVKPGLQRTTPVNVIAPMSWPCGALQLERIPANVLDKDEVPRFMAGLRLQSPTRLVVRPSHARGEWVC